MIDSEARGSYEEAAQSNSRNMQRQLAETGYRSQCDALLQALVARTNAEYAGSIAQVAADAATLRRFFVRSTIENVRRIDAMRKINPLVCYRAAGIDPVLCKQWGLYAADEGLHSRMFARDLHALGIEDAEIYGTPLFFSTDLLCGYLYQTLEEDGAMAVVTSGYYVESVSKMTQPAWLSLVEQELGTSATRGSRSHLALDDHEEHIDLAWNMSMRLVKNAEQRVRFERHIRRLHGLLSAYVGEVLAYSLGLDDRAAAQDAVRAARTS
jgi:hypothetical protein